MAEYLFELRKKIGTQKLLAPSTACIVLNHSGEVLLQLRSDLRCWGCPGGIIDIGETATESVIREVFEETGLVIESPWLFGVYSGDRYEGRYPNGDELAVVQLAFVAEGSSGELRGDEESSDLRYFSLEMLPTEIAPHHTAFLHHFQEFRNGERVVPVVM